MKEANDVYKKSKAELEFIFNKVCKMVKLTFKGNHFKKFILSGNNAKFSTAFNKAFYDIQMLGFVDFDIQDVQDNSDVIYNEFIELCYFNAVMIDNTNEKISERINTWKNLLSNIVTDDQGYFRRKLERKIDQFSNNPICIYCSERVEELHASYLDADSNAFFHATCFIKKDNIYPNKSQGRFAFDKIDSDIDIFLSYNRKNSNLATLRAQGFITKQGVTVKAGSNAILDNFPSLGSSVIKKKNELISEGVLVENDGILLFSIDYLFSSFSTPAEIILGSSQMEKSTGKQLVGKV